MYIDKIIDKRSPSLILCLAGWSTSPALSTIWKFRSRQTYGLPTITGRLLSKRR